MALACMMVIENTSFQSCFQTSGNISSNNKVPNMNIIKTAVAIFTIMASMTVLTEVSVAAEITPSSSVGLNETIVNIEKALREVQESAFSEAQLHLKTARSTAEQVKGDNAIIDQAKACVVQGQIEAKKGNIKASTDHLNKALGLYKSL
jgi:hypothetical protein